MLIYSKRKTLLTARTESRGQQTKPGPRDRRKKGSRHLAVCATHGQPGSFRVRCHLQLTPLLTRAAAISCWAISLARVDPETPRGSSFSIGNRIHTSRAGPPLHHLRSATPINRRGAPAACAASCQCRLSIDPSLAVAQG